MENPGALPSFSQNSVFSNISVTECFTQNLIPVIINGQNMLYKKRSIVLFLAKLDGFRPKAIFMTK